MQARIDRMCIQYPKGTVFYRGAASMVQFNSNLSQHGGALKEYQRQIRDSVGRYQKLESKEEKEFLECGKNILIEKTLYGTNNTFSERVPAEESARLIVSECYKHLPGPYPLSKIVRSLKRDDQFLLEAKRRGVRYETIRPKLEKIGSILEQIESGDLALGDKSGEVLAIPPHGFAAQLDDVFFFTQDRHLAKIYAKESKELVKFTVQRPFKLWDLSRLDVIRRLVKGDDAPFSSTTPIAEYEFAGNGFVNKRWFKLAKARFYDRLQEINREMKSMYKFDLEQSAYMSQQVLSDLKMAAETREFPVFSWHTPEEQWKSVLNDCRVITGQLLLGVPIIIATLNDLAIELVDSASTIAFMMRLEQAMGVNFDNHIYNKHILNTNSQEDSESVPKNVFQGYLDALSMDQMMPAGLRASNTDSEIMEWENEAELGDSLVKSILKMRFKRLQKFMQEWNELVIEEFNTYVPVMNDKWSEQEKIDYDVRNDPVTKMFIEKWICTESNNCSPVFSLSNDYAPLLPNVRSGAISVPWNSVKGLWISTNMKVLATDLTMKRSGISNGVESLKPDTEEWRLAHFRDSYYIFDEILLRALWKSPMMNPVYGVAGWMHPEPFEICVRKPERYGELEWEPVNLPSTGNGKKGAGENRSSRRKSRRRGSGNSRSKSNSTRRRFK